MRFTELIATVASQFGHVTDLTLVAQQTAEFWSHFQLFGFLSVYYTNEEISGTSMCIITRIDFSGTACSACGSAF